ncbi:short chain enoyl-CoA hydratase /3-hydroxyacyl-CoA dehydrogenase [Roseiarcus fermentans]|uniref:Short chain enoyl-CoA hydratase /3-hydroxyacyl-CoA dehydrogenase n=1 Tax=Roseiarcus fermentans TaxID=1473586 RepID=A0A366EEX2_9HYPH|nr:3-hydroxyacyl-CoA dehydrogenase NAD-binding domain-containing protein [Roseiarcus fermentans]RBP00868.1 short chain enoyl-CoA hydratase /3-hydroxyacyl-CoA dehydrogenase [Roseiarcus fermentans]
MTALNAVADLTVEDEVAIVTINSPPVNALSRDVREGLMLGVEKAEADATVKATVIVCAGRTFIAGADITEFGKPHAAPYLPDVLDRIENAKKPVVAALHGTALGGGFEVALTAHYRIAVPSAKCGLPEIKLGLIPGAGGTQRLPRLVGVETALEVILSGTPFSARDAKQWGVVDALAEEGKLAEGAVAFAKSLIAARAPLKKVRDRDEKLAAARGKPEIFEAIRQAHAKKFRGFEAWEKAILSVKNAVDLPFDEGVERERAMFMALLGSTQSKAQRHVFFAERAAAKIADIGPDTPTKPIARVGVIGAGTMGGGIAMNFLNAGIPVTIVETSKEALDRGVSIIQRNYENTAKKGRLTMAEVEARMGRLSLTLDFRALAEADLVIEAVYESMDLKKLIFEKLDGVAKPGAILASNTSYLNVDAIAAATKRPEDVLGMHFFSPANVMRLLEIVRGEKTSKTVLATVAALAPKIGKVGVTVGVCYGFVGNRMLAERQREAGKLILEGATPAQVDRVLTDFGLPMGPFAMSDLAGLDIGWSAETSKGESIRDILCEEGRRGQKTGAGFYDYDEQRNAKPSAHVETIIRAFAAAKGIAQRDITDAEILERLIYPMINEGAKILEEGKAQRASDIDVVWIMGYGWPVYRGGPMFYADTVGLNTVLDKLKEFQAKFGDDFRPAALLEKLAAAGGSFSKA